MLLFAVVPPGYPKFWEAIGRNSTLILAVQGALQMKRKLNPVFRVGPSYPCSR